ncbi:MAG: hypothetical protein M3220_10315 [Chloroflexota bacterium]|nr:hypothetical protein [Chloroflexota bacterium]
MHQHAENQAGQGQAPGVERIDQGVTGQAGKEAHQGIAFISPPPERHQPLVTISAQGKIW